MDWEKVNIYVFILLLLFPAVFGLLLSQSLFSVLSFVSQAKVGGREYGERQLEFRRI